MGARNNKDVSVVHKEKGVEAREEVVGDRLEQVAISCRCL